MREILCGRICSSQFCCFVVEVGGEQAKQWKKSYNNTICRNDSMTNRIRGAILFECIVKSIKPLLQSLKTKFMCVLLRTQLQLAVWA